ncbi:Odorant receptor Or79 [Rhyzopertha dominica]|nr:Odorant receptor Or79 [Rhyzopertha dominica]
MQIMISEYKHMEDDYLASAKSLPMIYYNNSFVRIMTKFLTFIFVIYHGIMAALCLYNGWNVSRIFVAAIFFTAQHVFITTCLMDNLYEDILELDEEMRSSFWAIEAASKELADHFKIIFGLLKLCERLFWVNLPLLSSIMLLTRFFPHWPVHIAIYLSYTVVYFLTACFGFVVMFKYAFIFFYYCIHAYVQTNLLGQYFSQIAKNLKRMKLNDRDRIIKERLIVGIQQHKKLKRFAEKLRKAFGGKRLAIPFLSAIACVPLWTFWIMTERTFMVEVALALLVCLLSAYGISGELFTIGYADCPNQLYKSNWYEWNRENKKLLLLFVILTNDEQSIEIFHPLSARLHMLIWFMKTFYSITAVLKSVYS